MGKVERHTEVGAYAITDPVLHRYHVSRVKRGDANVAQGEGWGFQMSGADKPPPAGTRGRGRGAGTCDEGLKSVLGTYVGSKIRD